MARHLLAALQAAGFSASLASQLRTHEPKGDRHKQVAIRAASDVEARRLVAEVHALAATERPRLWFTYHVYYKAPDWLGPAVSSALGIPYVVAEGSRASKREASAWALGHEGAQAALDHAAIVFILNEADRECLERDRPPNQALVSLPPFLVDASALQQDQRKTNTTPRLLAVAMMRNGDKLASYRLLADALVHIVDLPWHLTIVGDGPARGEVENLFLRFAERVAFSGSIADPRVLAAVYAAHDLFVWPAVNEAFGMVLLEAQAAGCPVVAGAYGGVPGVVADGLSGLLTQPGDTVAFAKAVRRLLLNPFERREMASAAQRFVAEERSLDRAAIGLRHALLPLTVAEGIA